MAERGSDSEVTERFRRFRADGDRRQRNDLIEEHRWLAVHCARRFAGKGEPVDDLIQVAQVGLLKAVERFDPDVGVSFPSYAMPTVLGELRRHFRDKTWSVRVPRRLKELHVAIGAARTQLASELERPPTPAELAEALGVTVDEVLEGLEASAAYRAGSVDAPAPSGGEDGPTLADRLPAEPVATTDRLLVDELLRTLPERERTIVELRFFGGLSQAEIAAQVGVSQVHVSRLLRSSLAAMQQAAGDPAAW